MLRIYERQRKPRLHVHKSTEHPLIISNKDVFDWSVEHIFQVRVVNLHQLNITDLGKMEPYGSGTRRNSPLEVFYNGQPLRLARWPNNVCFI